jgi:hypothetical protein
MFADVSEARRICWGPKMWPDCLSPYTSAIVSILDVLLHPESNSACLLSTVWLAYSLTLKMESVRSSETSVNFYTTTLRKIPEESKLPSAHCENFTKNIIFRMIYSLASAVFSCNYLSSIFKILL